MADDLTCPFCKESNFDAIGLKAHLFRWCEVFGTIESPEDEERRRKAQKEEVRDGK